MTRCRNCAKRLWPWSFKIIDQFDVFCSGSCLQEWQELKRRTLTTIEHFDQMFKGGKPE